MEGNHNTVYRGKNLQKAQDPEQFDRYLKLTGYKEWFVIAAAALMLAAVFVWLFFGAVSTVISGAGTSTDGTLVCYFRREDTEDLSPGTELNVEGTVYTVDHVYTELFTADEIPDEILYYLPEARWYSKVEAYGGDLKDGQYLVSFVKESAAPVSTRPDEG